jgi:hypothetical protein
MVGIESREFSNSYFPVINNKYYYYYYSCSGFYAFQIVLNLDFVFWLSSQLQKLPPQKQK